MSKVVPTHGLKAIDGSRPISDETIRGIAPTRTVGENYAPPTASRVADVLQLFKLRVTGMVVVTAWAGYLAAARHVGASFVSLKLLATLLGVGLVSAAAAAMNQVLERDLDAKMSRTKARPLAAGRISAPTALLAAVIAAMLGLGLLLYMANPLTSVLAALTALTYVFVYTPLKRVGPISTFIGAFPGAMPALLGWTAVSGTVQQEALALFAIVFCWQFPHFLAIAWLYREDYEQAGIRMLPVLDQTGRPTIRQILGFAMLLLPVSMLPFFLGMAGWIYFFGAIALGGFYLFFGIRLALLRLPPSAANSKKEARELLQASIAYLPLLFALLMISGGSR
jgi:heme o synthase